MRISLIVAMADNRVIGLDGAMPWHLSEDLKFFKAVTMGHPIIMGRKTYQSIGSALPGRTNIVITRNRDFEAIDAEVVYDLDDALKTGMAREELWGMDGARPEVFVIGGAEIYAQAMERAGRMYITEIHEEPPGDAYFPEFDRADWVETDRQDREPEGDGGPAYGFVILDRKG
ncbi:MAG: dihydrofolate reductase [Alphaproteobacteria bacterium]|jgi:dihydrofolate reductase|nr:dihydrofolate reductase [Alphaproteobacteria bacterium]